MLALRIAFVALLQAALLGQMIYERAKTLREGTPVLLKTEPIDPRSLFRGDYVALNYEVGSLAVEELEGDNDFERLQDAYVAIEPRGDYWTATGVYNEWPKIIGDQIIMKGRVTSVNVTRALCPDDDLLCPFEEREVTSVVLRVNYGIDSYFVPEGKGKSIEAATRDQDIAERVAVRVAVDENGTAAIKALVLDGEVLHEERIF